MLETSVDERKKDCEYRHSGCFIGPGFSEKDPPIKLQQAWKTVSVNAKLVGSPAAPRALLATLADTLAKEKPEVVFISTDAAPDGRRHQRNRMTGSTWTEALLSAMAPFRCLCRMLMKRKTNNSTGSRRE